MQTLLKMHYEKHVCLLWAPERKVAKKATDFITCPCRIYVGRYTYTHLYISLCVCVMLLLQQRQQSKINMHQRAARTAVNMLPVQRSWSSHRCGTLPRKPTRHATHFKWTTAATPPQLASTQQEAAVAHTSLHSPAN